jgi:hypothetical protein
MNKPEEVRVIQKKEVYKINAVTFLELNTHPSKTITIISVLAILKNHRIDKSLLWIVYSSAASTIFLFPK